MTLPLIPAAGCLPVRLLLVLDDGGGGCAGGAAAAAGVGWWRWMMVLVTALSHSGVMPMGQAVEGGGRCAHPPKPRINIASLGAFRELV